MLTWSPHSVFTLAFATDGEAVRTRLELDAKFFRLRVLREPMAPALAEQLWAFQVLLDRAHFEPEWKPQFIPPLSSPLEDS